MIEDIGKEIACPKCGERGKAAVERVNVKGKPYYYLSVRHTLGHGRSKRCLIRRLSDDEVAKLMVTKPLKASKPVTKMVTKPRPGRPQAPPKPPVKEIEEIRKAIDDLKTSFLDFQRTIQAQIGEMVRTLRREAEGEEIVGVVTKQDERRGKVYVPKEWIGRKVRVSLLKEEETNIPEKPQET